MTSCRCFLSIIILFLPSNLALLVHTPPLKYHFVNATKQIVTPVTVISVIAVLWEMKVSPLRLNQKYHLINIFSLILLLQLIVHEHVVRLQSPQPIKEQILKNGHIHAQVEHRFCCLAEGGGGGGLDNFY